MKYTLLGNLALGCMLSIGSISVMAEGNPAFYIGAKAGSMYVSDIEGANVNDPSSTSFNVGYDFGKGVAVEIEVTQADGADISYDNIFIGKLSIDTQAIYCAYRTQGTAYFKVRAGLLSEDIKLDAASFISEYSESESDTGLSVSAGGGFNIGDHVQLEAEYTIVEQDISMLNIGLNARF